MDITTGTELIEQIKELDERRRETFQAELKAFEAGSSDSFAQTRGCIEDEYNTLDELEQYLVEEREQLERLESETEFLSTNQAVRNRDEAIEKIRTRNDQLSQYATAVRNGLSAVERNITALEQGETELPENADPHFTKAQRAIEIHNEETEGLEKNLAILSAYLP